MGGDTRCGSFGCSRPGSVNQEHYPDVGGAVSHEC